MQSYSNSEDLFFAALEIPNSQRREFLAEAVVDSPAIRHEVERLIENHEKKLTNFILDRPAVSHSAEDSTVGEQEGDVIGSYRLLEKIGEGGMGVVYMAEQFEGVQRKVALKIIKLGMDTRQVVARFEAERQAMALFDHPNIARVLDAGSTTAGRPYFVMELVRGTDISTFVRGQKLDLNERLKLFISICNAIQHAHQKGIIHRDIKPSNILITQFDGVPVPKVIDFGIAKAIGQRLTDKTLFTRYAAMIGTPQYMSPEQAEMTGIDVDTRSDIYSLGVILYELITGSTPLNKEQLKKLNPLALFETLRDAEIETPSTRVAKSKMSADLAAPIDTQKTELDWVVMKSLERDRSQRYATANELSQDVQRYLQGDPVMAVPPSRLYRLKRYASKHRSFVLTASLVSVVLLISTIVSSIFAYNSYHLNKRLKSALITANEQRERAQKAEDDLRLEFEKQKYQTAISWAYSSFLGDFHEEVFSSAEQLEIPESTDPMDDMICFCIEMSTLLDFNLDYQNSLPVDRIREILEEFDSDMTSEEPAMEFAAETADVVEIHEHSPACLKFQETFKERIPEYRSKFFRLLVQRYRVVFGEKDPRVGEALTLLAASLIELKEKNEARAHLREAIALSKQDPTPIQKELLFLSR